MQIVTDIPENEYEWIKRASRQTTPLNRFCVKAIANGIPLPKGHGRLIDADALLDKKQDYGEGQMKLILIDPYYVRKAPTIIEGSESE